MDPARIATLLVLALALPAGAESAPTTPDEVQRQWLHRHDERHFTATLLRRKGKGGHRITVRRDTAEGRERVLLRFEKPHAVAGQSWLLLEQDTDDELYYYSVRNRGQAPRQIPSLKARNPLDGSDPVLLGLRAGSWKTRAEAVEVAEHDGKKALLLSERAVDPEAPFETRRVWIDSETGVAMRLEHESEGQVVLTGEVLELREVDGVATPMQVRFDRPEKEPVGFSFETIDYQRPIRASYFELPEP